MTIPEQDPYNAPTSPVGNNVTQGMTNCIACSNEIPKIASICVHCGVSQRTRGYRNKTMAGVLAMILGAFGVHRFYLGQWWGIFYLLTFWTFIPSIVSFFEAIVFWCSNLEKWDLKYNEGKPAGATEQAGAGLVIMIIVMIVYALLVVSVLAASVVPAYQDYEIRAQVSKSIAETQEHRAAIVDYYSQNEQLPTSLSEIDIESKELASGNVVELSDTGFVITFEGKQMALALGHTLEFNAYLNEDDQLKWDCTGGSLERHHRLSKCRGESESD